MHYFANKKCIVVIIGEEMKRFAEAATNSFFSGKLKSFTTIKDSQSPLYNWLKYFRPMILSKVQSQSFGYNALAFLS